MKQLRRHRFTLYLCAAMIGVLMASNLHFIANPGGARTQPVFVYSTLLNPVIRTVVCGCLVWPQPTTIGGYTKVGRDIVPSEFGNVTGGVITVSAWELQQIDRYEGIPEQYTRSTMRVDGRRVWVYLKN